MRCTWVLAAMCVATIACESDPARDIRIIKRAGGSAPPPEMAQTAGQWVMPAWQKEFCTLDAENGKGPSEFKGSGPCDFEHTGEAKCEASGDDFLVVVMRNAVNQATLTVFINVEFYTGPGDYNSGEAFVSVNSAKSSYRWVSDSFRVTVAPGQKSLTVHNAVLHPERPLTEALMIDGTLECEKKP